MTGAVATPRSQRKTGGEPESTIVRLSTPAKRSIEHAVSLIARRIRWRGDAPSRVARVNRHSPLDARNGTCAPARSGRRPGRRVRTVGDTVLPVARCGEERRRYVADREPDGSRASAARGYGPATASRPPSTVAVRWTPPPQADGQCRQGSRSKARRPRGSSHPARVTRAAPRARLAPAERTPYLMAPQTQRRRPLR